VSDESLPDVTIREYKRDLSARTFGAKSTRISEESRIVYWIAAFAAVLGAILYAWIR